MRVRDTEPADAAAVATLLDVLGYAVDAEVLAGRLRSATDSDDAAWVAVRDDEPVIGFAAGHRFQPFELDAPVAELTALVVADDQRRSGAGRALVARFEEWAAGAGCIRVSVATSFRREVAHRFYEALGYEQLARKYEKNS